MIIKVYAFKLIELERGLSNKFEALHFLGKLGSL